MFLLLSFLSFKRMVQQSYSWVFYLEEPHIFLSPLPSSKNSLCFSLLSLIELAIVVFPFLLLGLHVFFLLYSLLTQLFWHRILILLIFFCLFSFSAFNHVSNNLKLYNCKIKRIYALPYDSKTTKPHTKKPCMK